jgi:hypothetical protein
MFSFNFFKNSYDTANDEENKILKTNSKTKLNIAKTDKKFISENRFSTSNKKLKHMLRNPIFSKAIESPEIVNPDLINDDNNNLLAHNLTLKQHEISANMNTSTATILINSSSFASTPNKYERTINMSNEDNGQFQSSIHYLNFYLDNLVQQETPFGNKEQNRLTLEVFEMNLFDSRDVLSHFLIQIILRLSIWPRT